MLIKLKDNLIDLLNNNKFSETSIEILAINDLARSCYEKNHILYGSYDVFEFLSNYYLCNNLSKKIYTRLLSMSTFAKGYLNNVNIYIEVCADITSIKYDIDNKCWLVPLPFLKSITSSTLIVENTIDYDFYLKLIKRFYIDIDNLEFSINLNPLHLGGPNSNNTIETYAKSNLILFAIADSDKYFKTDNYKSTADSIINGLKYLENSNIVNNYILDVREKENLLSIKIFLNRLFNYNNENLLQFIYNNINEFDEFCCFGDIKDGPSIKEYWNVKAKYGEHTKMVVDELIKNKILDINVIDSSRNENDKIFSGIGGQFNELLNKYIINDYLENINLKLVNGYIDKIQADNLIKLYNELQFDLVSQVRTERFKKICNNIIDFGICLNDDFVFI